jgi:hypothetical protein
MITVRSSNQTIGVILEFMRHLFIGFVCRQTDLHTVYNKRRRNARGGEHEDMKPVGSDDARCILRYDPSRTRGFRGSYFLAERYSRSRSIALSMFSTEFA